jgi:ferritin
MLSQTLHDAINEQLNYELYSAYIYLAMAAYYDSITRPGFAHWMRVQAQEEVEHAMKFYTYIYDRGGKVALQAIAQPPADFRSELDAFEKALAHERKVTARINDLYAQAVKDNDYASQSFLRWFVDEQVQEERDASQIVEMLKMIGDSKNGLFMLDHELGERKG